MSRILSLIIVFLLLSTNTVIGNNYKNQSIKKIGCVVIDNTDGYIVCNPIADASLGDIFSFVYTKDTKARTVPRLGRFINVYYIDTQHRPHTLYDWFLYRKS